MAEQDAVSIRKRTGKTISQLKELAMEDERALAIIYQHIHEQTKKAAGISAELLEVCLREVYGRLDLLDLFKERRELLKEVNQVDLKIARIIGNNRRITLAEDPKELALSLSYQIDQARNGGLLNLKNVLPPAVEEEFLQVAEERGIELAIALPPTYPRSTELLQAYRNAESLSDIKKIQEREYARAMEALKAVTPPTPEEGSV